MAFIPAPRTVRVAITTQASGRPLVTVFNFQKSVGSVTAPDVALVAAHVSNWWATQLKPQMSNEVAGVNVKADDISIANSFSFTDSIINGQLGAVASPIVPLNAAIVISWRTGFRGRSYRGRTYHAGLMEVYTVGNFVDVAYANSLQARYDDLRINPPAGFGMVIASYQANKAPRSIAELTPVISSDANNRIDSQRRRLARL